MTKQSLEQQEVMHIGRVPFQVTTLDEAAQWVIRTASRRGTPETGLSVRLSNAWCVVMANDDPEYMRILGAPGVTLPDGAPVAWLMRRWGAPFGPDLSPRPKPLRNYLGRGPVELN